MHEASSSEAVMGISKKVARAAQTIGCRWPVDEARIHDESPGRAPSRVFRALETALCADDVDTVAEIIKERPSALLEVNQYGCPPMMMARSRRAVELLLPHSNPNAADDDGGTSLGYMASVGAVGALAALLPHADPRKADGFGVTPLMAAARDGHRKAVELLMGVSDLGARDKSGRTALMMAAVANCEKSVGLLLAGSPMDAVSTMDALDADGMDALMLAARSSKFEYGPKKAGSRIVAMLVERSDQSRLCCKGKSAFEYALEGADSSAGAKEAALLLIDGVDTEARDAAGRSLVERVASLMDGKASKGWWMSEVERRVFSEKTSKGSDVSRRSLRV